ncbi:hypothetical protein GQ53DRAFT_820648 [Thozetella sp. PMI_491]|nr:hypothetical protein GQ53DRAFT_820648 [Thozetella sp. PMI_491]
MEHLLARLTSRDDIPEGYQPPPFPSLHWPPQDIQDMQWNLYRISDIWRFTLLWTVFIYAGFHLGAAGIALLMQVGKGKERWKYIWTVPFLYAFAAGIEALCAGSVVGAMLSRRKLPGWAFHHVDLDTFYLGVG